MYAARHQPEPCRRRDRPEQRHRDQMEEDRRRAFRETLTRVAAYFGVSVDRLLEVETPASDSMGMDDFTYALYNETQTLTEENKQKLLEMARFFRQQQEKEGR